MKLLNIFKRHKQVNTKYDVDIGMLWANLFDSVLEGYSSLSDNVEFKSAIEKISDLVSNMSIHLMRNTEDGNIREYNELARLIDITPSQYMTRKSLMFWITQSLLLYGNAIVIPKVKNGKINELIPIPFSSVVPTYENEQLAIRYKDKLFLYGEYIHFQLNPTAKNPFYGTGYNRILKDVVDNIKNANHVKKTYMKGKYMPSIVIRIDSQSEEFISEQGKQKIEDMYLKRTKTGAPWIIPSDTLELQQIKPLTLDDLKINDAITIDKTTVATAIGIPLFLLGVGTFDKEEYNNFISNRIMGIAQVIEQTLTKTLVDDPKCFFKCNVRSLYSYNITELAQVGTSLYERGLALGNEIRGWVGLDPENRESWKNPVILENYIPIDKIGDQSKLKGGDTNGETNESINN